MHGLLYNKLHSLNALAKSFASLSSAEVEMDDSKESSSDGDDNSSGMELTLKELQQHGLGKEVDITQPNPMDLECGFTHDLSNESVKVTPKPEAREEYYVVLSNSEVQVGFKAGGTILKIPVQAFATAKLGRSKTKSKRVRSKYTCLTSAMTISFQEKASWKWSLQNIETDSRQWMTTGAEDSLKCMGT